MDDSAAPPARQQSLRDGVLGIRHTTGFLRAAAAWNPSSRGDERVATGRGLIKRNALLLMRE